MLTPARLSTRIAIPVAAVLFMYAGFEVARWSEKPLGESPRIEFPSPIGQSEVEQFLDGDFQLIKDMKALPEPLIHAFTEIGGSRLTVANPGKRFEATDAIWDDTLPQKRLVIAGLSGNKCFMLYEQGGIIHFFVLALFKLSPPNVLNSLS